MYILVLLLSPLLSSTMGLISPGLAGEREENLAAFHGFGLAGSWSTHCNPSRGWFLKYALNESGNVIEEEIHLKEGHDDDWNVKEYYRATSQGDEIKLRRFDGREFSSLTLKREGEDGLRWWRSSNLRGLLVSEGEALSLHHGFPADPKWERAPLLKRCPFQIVTRFRVQFTEGACPTSGASERC